MTAGNLIWIRRYAKDDKWAGSLSMKVFLPSLTDKQSQENVIDRRWMWSTDDDDDGAEFDKWASEELWRFELAEPGGSGWTKIIKHVIKDCNRKDVKGECSRKRKWSSYTLF